MSPVNVAAVAAEFMLEGAVDQVEEIPSGLINKTYRVRCSGGSYILQRINTQVFSNVEAVMKNIAAVLKHLETKVEDENRLKPISTKAGELLFHEGDHVWRCFNEIENCKSIDAVKTSEQAYAAGKGFGAFLKMLADFPVDQLEETIPRFHHTPSRYFQLLSVFETSTNGRVEKARKEMEFVQEREQTIYLLDEAELPLRVVHNDTKISNILFDAETGEPRCVIDLDTVMPGSALHDFGDFMRSSVTGQSEDKGEVVEVREDLFNALIKGYLEETESLLTDTEKNLLARSAEVIALELGIRFLTDYLKNDVYFGAGYEEENLDRARKQFELVQALEEKKSLD